MIYNLPILTDRTLITALSEAMGANALGSDAGMVVTEEKSSKRDRVTGIHAILEQKRLLMLCFWSKLTPEMLWVHKSKLETREDISLTLIQQKRHRDY